MADSSHLERMGSELKCPICLSLLNSAVSLPCNHVFCNACIVKSMKLGSDCPVCKVPYRRREVRPAPHMDNLVSIYKTMEVASGINIFVTQNAPSTKLPDGKNQAEGDQNCGGQEAACQDRAENQRTFRGKRSKKLLKTNPKNSGPNPVKPSFPTKKRVQVPQCPLPESPTRPAKFEGGLGEITKDGPNNSSIVLSEKPVLYHQGEPVFSPFFWLREEDVEKLSQQMDGDHVTDTPPLNAPSFSDIKDSDDEFPSKISPKGEVHSKSNITDFLDSEMFEWTQRACSPELCSSPIKIKENELEAASQGATTNGEEPNTENSRSVNPKQGTGIEDVGPSYMSSPRTKDANGQNVTKISKKRGRKASERAQMKHAKRNVDQLLGIHVDLKKVAENVVQQQTSDNNGSSLNMEKGTSKRTKKVGFDASATELTPKSVPTVSVEAKPQNQSDENIVTELPASLRKKQGSDKEHNLNKSGKSCKKINTQYQKDCPKRSKNRKLDCTKNNMLQEVSITQNQRNEDMIPQLSYLFLPVDDDKQASDFAEKPSKCGRKMKSAIYPKYNRGLRCSKKLKVSSDDISKDRLVDDIQEGRSEVAAEETQPIKKAQRNPDVRVLDDSSTAEKVLSVTNGVVLRKCETIPNKIQCAFCHSTEDSEVCGEMVHYFNGRPIAADHSGGSSVIHSHRNCTEWAPNVYFEDDTAINLEAELARSRRIKCCCCGVKGAALGCYEKSCRKSFHVPCAKLVPQCRWDTDNFVMLCPLHTSSKLPNEISGSQGKRRKKCIPKGQSHTQRAQVAVKHDTGTSWQWNSCGSADKFVLCCSALSIAEKETVSEFERLSGVTELKKWDSSVTHVIASTDENGACRRTLKILMGILEGRWILSIEWIKACMKAMEPIDEKQYEISVDIHGIRDGPQLGRLRLLNKQPKLFNGLKFYFSGEFIPTYKGYLQDLVIAAGGTVLHRKPISVGQEALLSGSSTFIIYSLELPDKCDPRKKNLIFNRRQSEAEALASSTGAKVASNSWVLNSIAACKLQNFAE